MSAFAREKKEGHEPVDGSLSRCWTARQDWRIDARGQHLLVSGFQMKM
jgi:hypothetical protein